MTAPGDGSSGIEVTTKIFPLAFLLLLFKTNVTVDGVTSIQPWGSHVFSVPPGRHEVAVSFRYIFTSAMGESRVTLDVRAGQTVQVQYRSPFLVFMGGSIKVIGPSPAP
jgi:hypothetical protein